MPVRCAAVMAGAAVTALPLIARAQLGEDVRFEADQAEIEPDAPSVRLEGNVRVTCGRYQLRAHRLALRPTSQGDVLIDGPAIVTLCPCEDAPIELGFDRARITPPSDIVVDSPRLRIGGVTVIALPAMWLRTPDQPGLLVPKIAWRASDGLLIGPGFHMPLDDAGEDSLDVYVSGYTAGGIEVAPTIRTERSWTAVRYEHLHGELVEVLSHGNTVADSDEVAVAWFGDIARGNRVPAGLISLQSATMPYDEARAMVAARPAGSLMVGTSMQAYGMRREQQMLQLGPSLIVAASDRLADNVVWQAELATTVMGADEGASQVSRAGAGASLHEHLGPLAMRLSGRGVGAAWLRPDESATELAGWSVFRAGVPMVRRSPSSGLVHMVEPLAQAALVGVGGDGSASIVTARPQIMGPGTAWMSGAGGRTTLGTWDYQSNATFEVFLGTVGHVSEREAAPVVLTQGDAQLEVLSISVQAAAQRTDDANGLALVGDVGLGRPDGLRIGSTVSFRRGIDPAVARVLWLGHAGSMSAGWLTLEGTSVASRGALPLSRAVEAFGSVDVDADGEALLAAGGGLSYRHPCGCVAATGWAGARQGREGMDAWLLLDLMP